MKLGLCIPNNQGVEQVSSLLQLGVEAEQIGYDSVWVSEHLFHSSYVAKRLGNRPYHDPLTVLTGIACQTQRVRLGTSVLVLPWHHPVRLGKSIATLDQLSGGRVDLGVGVAVTEDEFENLGVDFVSRGRRTNDALAALRALWYQDVPEHDGEFYHFRGQRFSPKPLQDPLPVHIGGGAPVALKRVARFGNGWHALGKSPAEVAKDIESLRALLRVSERDPGSIHVSIRCGVRFVDDTWDTPVSDRRTATGTADEIHAMIDAYGQAGVDEFVVDPGSPDLDVNRDVMQKVRSLVPM